MARIAVFGGGFAGLRAAFLLQRLLPPEHTIWLIDREDSFVFHPSLIWVATGARTLSQISFSRRRLLRGSRIHFLQKALTALHPQEHRFETTDGSFPFDYAVLALGHGDGEKEIPGLAGHNHAPCIPSRALAFYRRLQDMDGGSLLFVNAPGVRYSFPLLEMLLAVEQHLRRQGRRGRFELVYAEAAGGAAREGGPRLDTRIEALLQRRQIRWIPDWHLQRVEARQAFDVLGRSLPYDLLMAMPPHIPATVVAESPLGEAGGWPRVDQTLRSVRFPHLYLAGDTAALGVPKGGFLAQQAGTVAARNLAVAVTGRGRERSFPGSLIYMLDTADGAGILVSRPVYQATLPLLLHGPVVHWGKLGFETLFLRTPLFTRWAL